MKKNTKNNKNNKKKQNCVYKLFSLLGLFLASIVLTIGWVLSYLGFFSWLWSAQNQKSPSQVNYNYSQTAYFAWGCFWCMESIFEKQNGVEGAYVWYTGWDESTATYEITSAKNTQHREAVRVVYDPNVITYRKLVELFWTQIDPRDAGGQFNDRGYVYSTAIFYNNDEEKLIAQQSKNNLEVSKRFDAPIATEIEAVKDFYDAEEYHQDYYKNNSIRYNLYTAWSGRKQFIENNWQDRIDELEWKDYVNWVLTKTQSHNKSTSQFSDQELRDKLTPLQYRVTQLDGTEPAFNNKYWDNKEAGIYVDIIDGTPLYSSLDKFDSGTGWPSFSKSIDDTHLSLKTDTRYFLVRTSVDSATSWAHLGHIFNDAPIELGWIRHCINSASLRFIPVADLQSEGYSEYIEMFE